MKVRVTEANQEGWGVEKDEVGEEVRSQILLGSDGHGENFDFYLQRYVKLLRDYKESQSVDF